MKRDQEGSETSRNKQRAIMVRSAPFERQDLNRKFLMVKLSILNQFDRCYFLDCVRLK